VIDRCTTEHPVLAPTDSPEHLFRCWNPVDFKS
jgi:hypothetical protein